jgi:hypothetical protein
VAYVPDETDLYGAAGPLLAPGGAGVEMVGGAGFEPVVLAPAG